VAACGTGKITKEDETEIPTEVKVEIELPNRMGNMKGIRV